MAGRRVYGGSNMSVLLQDEGISPHAYEAMLSSGSSHGGFHGSRSMLNFEEVCGLTISQQLYCPMSSEEGGGGGDEELDECLHQPEKKRRLTVHQVQFLERSFEMENKLEPERKIQLAKDLGLQPRQVAIWFQNRRARWKTKQLEKDYEALKSSYNALKVDYENLLKEKDKLKSEVILLSDKLLLKEKGKNITDQATEPKREPNVEFAIDQEPKNSEAQILVPKQEDLSSTNSAVFDSDSPRCTDEGGPTDSSNAFELDQSDLSHNEDDEVKGYHEFLKLEDNAGSFGFPVEDHPLWLWPY